MMEVTWEDFYLGSRRFKFLGDYLGVSIDQVNFIISQALALLLGFVFRVYLHPEKVSASTRHWTALSGGLCISYFCFGKQILLALFLVVMCYCILNLLPPAIFHHTTLFVSITFLSVIHIQRQFYQDGAMVLDITGPLMIMVQKVTSLAYSLHDGFVKKEEKLTQLQKSFLIREKPSFLEYFSYLLCFQSILAGPYFMFTDYQDFIEGTHYIRYASLKNNFGKNPKELSLDDNRNSPATVQHSSAKGDLKMKRTDEPDPTQTVLWKVLASFVCAFLTIRVAPLFPSKTLADASFISSSSFVQRLFYIIASTTLVRQMYYTGWFLSDAVCNMSGLGFSGFDENGNASWDHVSNVDFFGVEFGDSFKVTLEAWNIGTMKWLRFLVYERAAAQRTVLTYLLSSLWHGFYPGYYLTFLSGAFFTISARTARRCIRHHALACGPYVKRAYDFCTFVLTRLILSYSTFPFILLRFWQSVRVYTSIWFYMHVLGALCLVLLPRILPPQKSRQETASSRISNGVASISKGTKAL